MIKVSIIDTVADVSSNSALDSTGKYKTGKCTIEYFLNTAQSYGIALSGSSMRALREKVLPGSQDVISYVPAVKDLHLKINHDEEDSSSRLYEFRIN